MNGNIKLEAFAVRSVGLSYVFSGMNILSEVTVFNSSDRDISDLKLSVSSDDDFGLFAEYDVGFIKGGEKIRFNAFGSPNPEYFANITEPKTLNILVSVSLDNEVLEAVSIPVEAVPPNVWLGVSSPKNTLMSFVDSGDYSVKDIFSKELSETENAVYKEKLSFDDIKDISENIYGVLQSFSFKTVSVPSLLERQNIRSFSEVLESKTATVTEVSLILLSFLEKCGICGSLYLSEKDAYVKLEKGRDKFYISAAALLENAPFEENIISADKKTISESVAFSLKECRESGILPMSNYDVYSSSERKVFENIADKKTKDSESAEEYVTEPYGSYRRAAVLIKQGQSFIFDVPVFSDWQKHLGFILERLIKYGKTAAVLFETEEEKKSFERYFSESFPQMFPLSSRAVSVSALTEKLSSDTDGYKEYEKALSLLEKEESKLSLLSDALKSKSGCGLSFSDAVAYIDKYSDVKVPFGFSDSYTETVSEEDFKFDRYLCSRFAKLAFKTKDLDLGFLERAGVTEISEYDAEILKSLFEKRKESADKIRKILKIYADIFGIPVDSYEKWRAALDFSRIVVSEDTVPETLVRYNHLYEIADTVREASSAGRLRDSSEKFICENFSRDIFNYNAESASSQWEEAANKRSVIRNYEYGKIRKTLSAFAYDPSKIKTEDIPPILEKLKEYKENRDRVLSLGSSVSPVFGTSWNRGYCDWDAFENCYKNACSVRRITDILYGGNVYREELSNGLLSKINSESFRTKYLPFLEAAIEEFKTLSECEAEISEYCNCDFGKFYKAETFYDVLGFTDIIPSSASLVSDRFELSGVRSVLGERNLSFIADAIEKNPDINDGADAWFMKAASASFLSVFLKSHSNVLKYNAGFFGKRTESILTVKRSLESKKPSALFSEALARIKENAEYQGELEFLKKDTRGEISVSKLKKHCPLIYSLFFPAELFSESLPLQGSSADYLILADNGGLDAENINSVSDRFSAFAEVTDTAVNKGELITFIKESGFEKVRYLYADCHTDASLLPWAKNYIYGGALKFLPSELSDSCLIFAEGSSSRGINVGEVGEIYRILSDISKNASSPVSVKIAAFSKKQAKAVRLLTDKKMTLSENVSVTVETVFGSFSECDLLILTTAYSGDSSEIKYFADFYGTEYDESDAVRYLLSGKRFCFVSSLSEDEVRHINAFSPALNLLKNLWLSLSSGKNPSVPFGKASLSDGVFPETVRREGEIFVKTSASDNLYRSASGKYLLYDIAESVMEDAEFYDGLRALGYDTVREFSSDRLAELLHKEDLPFSEREVKEFSEDVPEEQRREDEREYREAEFLRYTVCTFDNKPDLAENAEEFMANYNNPDIRRDIISVVKAESPVSLHTLSKRVLSHWGISRCGVRLENKILSLAKNLDLYSETADGIRFFWNTKDEKKNYGIFRIPDNNGTKREITDIAPEELANVYKYISEEYKIISVSKANRELIKILGFGRVTEKVTEHLKLSLETAEKRGLLKIVKGKIIRN